MYAIYTRIPHLCIYFAFSLALINRIFSHEFPGHLVSIGGKACLVLTRLVSMHLSQSSSAMVAALFTNMSSLPNVSRVLLITAESKIVYMHI